MDYCPKCGAEVANQTNFCSECGKDLQTDNSERFSDKRARRVNPLITRRNLGDEPEEWNNPWLARISSLVAFGIVFWIASWAYPVGNSPIAFVLAVGALGFLFWYALVSLAAHIDMGWGGQNR